MGSSFSNLKGTSSPQIGKVGTFSCSTVSSERTMVHSTPVESKKFSIFDSTSKNKSSMLPSRNFFGNLRRKKNMRQDNVRLNSANVNSLSRRNQMKDSRKKIVAAITKSMIGRPTNFKHVNSATTQHNQLQFIQDDEEEASRVAAQMAILSTMLKPLPDNNYDGIPVIPTRTSSYGNDLYLKEFPIPEATSIATPSMRKNRKMVTGMKSHSAHATGSITKRKHTQYHMRSTKRSC